ncbi:MAG: hypothetical protein JWQ27_543 [Ferruginibacter sp.]|nr:hypothetical protein [Ferruginibacter sp.]
MRKILVCFLFAAISTAAVAQKNYTEQLLKFQQAYVDSHEVVKGKDRAAIHFYPVNNRYHVPAKFERIQDSIGFMMATSGKTPKKFFRYGLLVFSIEGHPCKLTLFQSEQLKADPAWKNYLFLPFTDLTSGEESYGGGRYLDIRIPEISNHTLWLDFNKAYNPYCAYTIGYNCPIPPRENDLPIPIRAGEKQFSIAH